MTQSKSVTLYLCACAFSLLAMTVIFTASMNAADHQACRDQGGMPMKSNRGAECVRGGK